MPAGNISTFARYMYLNSYAFLLILLGGGIVFIPLYRISLWLTGLQLILFFTCMVNGTKILGSWKDKQRKYHILMERNSTEFRPETFYEYIQAPCGRLLVKTVLKDLGQEEKYPELRALRKPFMENLKSGCRPVKTVIYLNGEKL